MGQFASSSHQHGFSRSILCSVKEPKLDGMGMGASGTEEPVASQRLSSSFQLMRVRNLPQWANKGCVGIGDVIQVRQVDTNLLWVLYYCNFHCFYASFSIFTS